MASSYTSSVLEILTASMEVVFIQLPKFEYRGSSNANMYTLSVNHSIKTDKTKQIIQHSAFTPQVRSRPVDLHAL